MKLANPVKLMSNIVSNKIERVLLLQIPLWIVLLISLTACQRCSDELDPVIRYDPPKAYIDHLPPALFPELTEMDLRQTWGKEFYIGQVFAREYDFYRAITAFKRALILIPDEKIERRLQIEYEVVLCYYLANKYAEAIEAFESGRLFQITHEFPAFHEVSLILFDCYEKTQQPEKACAILNLINQVNPEEAQTLELGTALSHADFKAIQQLSFGLPSESAVQDFVCDFKKNSKSMQRAQFLNAVLPGAGYLYIGQSKSALTSFLLNGLFIAAAYQFFHRGDIAAGIITTSFELGWYLGGINGVGIEARQYNRYLYQTKAEQLMIKEGLFPVLLFQAAF